MAGRIAGRDQNHVDPNDRLRRRDHDRSESDESRVSHNTAKLTVEGTTFYLCALGFDDNVEGSKLGCIVFDGTPNDGFRKKIRTALSFALGLYLVDLGTSHYDRNWHIVSTLARSAYSLDRRAFDMGPDQLAPLGPRYRNELNPGQLTRAVTALVSAFDELDLANLSWAYWHACDAPYRARSFWRGRRSSAERLHQGSPERGSRELGAEGSLGAATSKHGRRY